MGKKRSTPNTQERQLFHQFEDLAESLSDIDELGSGIGLCLFDSLSRFKFSSTSEKEREFAEIRRVYSGLENYKEKISQGNRTQTILSYQEGVKNYFSSNQKITPLEIIQKRLAIGSFDRSLLFHGLVDTINIMDSNRNDLLRRYGLDLLERVNKRGLQEGNFNCLVADYQDIYRAFIREKGDRRK